MDESRRSVMKKIGCAAGVGLGCSFPLLRALATSREASGEEKVPGAKQYGMVIDIKKCLTEEVRHACSEACRRQHNLPEISDPERQIEWIWTDTFEHTFPDQTHARLGNKLRGQPVLVLCNHCTYPACVKVCPTGATWKSKSDGIVMMDMHRCIGCRYCVVACPYRTRRFNWGDGRPNVKGEIRSKYPTRERGVVEKCNFCADILRSEGPEALPVCVKAANSVQKGTMTFGDLSDPESDISKVLREKHTISRQLALGTSPNVFYIV
jgi:Fe-S-cluster-containing dehydrogenase component